MRVVVTGSAGFIGSRLVTALRARGDDVLGLDLRASEGTEGADLSRPGPWQQRVHGADLVIHTAAVVGEQAPAKAYRAVNVDGTAHVVAACAEGGVGRLVHLSSIVVHGSDFPDGVTEDAPVRPTGNPYTDTKIVSELTVVAAHAAGRVSATVVRPGDVYGPGSVPWTLRPVQMMRKGQFALVDGGRGVLSPVYVDDLVSGILTAAEAGSAAGQVLHVTGGVGVPTAEFFGRYAAMLGISLRSVPTTLARTLAAPLGLAARFGATVPLQPRTFEYVSHPGTYSIARVTAHTGWRPLVDLDEGMARTEAWLRAHGHVDRRAPGQKY